jgi:GTP-binding protein
VGNGNNMTVQELLAAYAAGERDFSGADLDGAKIERANPYTISINVGVNTSALAGTEGKKLTSRMIRERLNDEANTNITIKINDTDSSETFEVYGCSELHLGVLVENMRREGFELTVSKVQILFRRSKDNPERLLEPYYEVVADAPTDYSGEIIEALNHRKGVMIEMFESEADTTRIVYHVALRFLTGFRQEFTQTTRGFGLLNQVFLKYDEVINSDLEKNRKGALVSSETGEAVGYALAKLQDRGIMYIQPKQKVYSGMIVGENTRNEDMEINVNKGKALSSMRASGSEEAYNLTPPKIMLLPEMLAYINSDECIEVTPVSLRMRKIVLDATQRKSKMGTISRNSYKIVED